MRRYPNIAVGPVVAVLVMAFLGCANRRHVTMEIPSIPSEDVSHLLVTPLSAAGEIDFDAPRDYLPDPHVDWVITFDFDEPVSGDEIKASLDILWQEENGRPTIYGFSTDDNHWTFVAAADSPNRFSRLKIAWALWDAIDEEPTGTTVGDLVQFRLAAEQKLAMLGSYKPEVDRSIEDSLAIVSALPALVYECDQVVTLKLMAPNGSKLSGRDVWDVMLCLGLDYGDGDLFHWINNSNFGSDLFFTVETSTPPGYFIPRLMASGEGDVADLIFSFSIPRSADPVAVFDSMVRAVEYAQGRLGGEIVLGTGRQFEIEGERAKIQAIVNRLKQAGFIPGESATCRVF